MCHGGKHFLWLQLQGTGGPVNPLPLHCHGGKGELQLQYGLLCTLADALLQFVLGIIHVLHLQVH